MRKHAAPTEESKSGQDKDPRSLRNYAQQLAGMAKGLADENRLRILLVVADGRKSVGQVVDEVDLSQPLVSHHLKELRLSGLVTVEREGPFVFYEIAGPQVLSALFDLAGLIRG